MNIEDFSYSLPENLIAKKPPTIRGQSRLLTYDLQTKKIVDDLYSHFVDYLLPGDVVVINDTKVIPARLIVHKKSNLAKRELILIEQHGQQDNWFEHRVVYRGKINPGEILITINQIELVVKEILDDGLAVIQSPINLLNLADEIGLVPLPPYLKRSATLEDKERYQTVQATKKGSVAAPTASLNLTKELIEQIEQKATICYLTLHVGLGTFLPIRTQKIEDHHMHKEYFEISASSAEILKTAKQHNQRLIAVGTTVARTLEYAHQQIMNHQSNQDLHGEADIFIYPGYQFQMIDGLLTNYHAPKSTVLMLVSAFTGWPTLQKLYNHAIKQQYKFLSYGDSMLLLNYSHSPKN